MAGRGIAQNAVFFHSFVASQARKVSTQKRELRRIGCRRRRQNLHHAVARERFGSQNRLKKQALGPLFEVQSAFRVASAGISTKHTYENGSKVL